MIQHIWYMGYYAIINISHIISSMVHHTYSNVSRPLFHSHNWEDIWSVGFGKDSSDMIPQIAVNRYFLGCY